MSADLTDDGWDVTVGRTDDRLRLYDEIYKDRGLGYEIKEFTEVAACGTAVVVTPVWEITRGSEVIKISGQDEVGPHLQQLFDTVQGIQYGLLPDTHGWCHEVK